MRIWCAPRCTYTHLPNARVVSCGGHLTWDAGIHYVVELFLKGIPLGVDVKFAHCVEISRTEITDLLANFCPVGFRKEMDLLG